MYRWNNIQNAQTTEGMGEVTILVGPRTSFLSIYPRLHPNLHYPEFPAIWPNLNNTFSLLIKALIQCQNYTCVTPSAKISFSSVIRLLS